MDERSLYDRVGGMPFFERLVDAFYAGVADDDVLAPLYPEYPDFTGARHRLTLFLGQYWGGPTTYMEERGHPRLRMRHFPFHIGPVERDHWLQRMAAAIESVCEAEQADVAAELIGYFVPTAEHLRNDTGLPITSSKFNLVPAPGDWADDDSAATSNVTEPPVTGADDGV